MNKLRLSEVFKHVLWGLYPRVCIICSGVLKDRSAMLCEECYLSADRYAHYCHRCGELLMRDTNCVICEDGVNKDAVIDAYIIGYSYQSVVRDLIIQLKFHRKMYMVRGIQSLLLPVIDDNAVLLEGADCIIPMPIDRVRLAERGFNHMLEIANPLSKILNKPIQHNVLSKQAFSIPQSDLSRKERLKNIKNALICKPVEGHVLLVDDVLTTGSTLRAAADFLKRAGADKVTVLVLARA